MQVQLKNAIYKELIQLQNKGGVPGPLEVPLPHLKEPLDFLREAQEDWESKLRRGINTLCTEKGVPLSKEVSCSKGVPLSKEVPCSKGVPLSKEVPCSKGVPLSKEVSCSKGVPLSKEVPCSKGVPLSKEVPCSKGASL